MALVKALKGDGGKPGQVEDTDIANQNHVGRVYTPTISGLSLSANPDHQWLTDDTGPGPGFLISQATDTTTGTAVDLTETTGSNPPHQIPVTIGTQINVEAFRFDGSGENIKQTSGIVRSDFFVGTGTSTKYSFCQWFESTEEDGVLWQLGTSNTYPKLDLIDVGGNMTLQWRAGGVGDPNQIQTLAGDIVVNNYFFVAGSYDASVLPSGKARLYIGKVGTDTVTELIPGGDPLGGTPFTGNPGEFHFGSNDANNITFAGRMARLYWWNDHVVSKTDFDTIYQGGNPFFKNLQDSPGPSDGHVVYIDSSGEIDSANSNQSLTSSAIGFYEATYDTIQTGKGQEIINFVVESAITMAAGDTAYLSCSDRGTITNLPPFNSGCHVIKLGTMESATKLILDIQFLYAID